MAAIGGQRNLANHMHNFATSIKSAITAHGIVNDPTYGQVYAYEVDGYGSGEFTGPQASASLTFCSKPNGRRKYS